ncbi:MAG: hypothetical protein KatS3mg060_0609 [Dehalococcoidia bacterium]|jgi:hypothetical protein|nr:MAG: hypothetical protein KatS3mg060_0609 [Dehalococcoidia bacterium]
MPSSRRPWWPHVELRTSAYWRGKVWLFRVVPEAILEFADRIEVYELENAELAWLQQMSYHERIAALLKRRPDRVEPKVAPASSLVDGTLARW